MRKQPDHTAAASVPLVEAAPSLLTQLALYPRGARSLDSMFAHRGSIAPKLGRRQVRRTATDEMVITNVNARTSNGQDRIRVRTDRPDQPERWVQHGGAFRVYGEGQDDWRQWRCGIVPPREGDSGRFRGVVQQARSNSFPTLPATQNERRMVVRRLWQSCACPQRRSGQRTSAWCPGSEASVLKSLSLDVRRSPIAKMCTSCSDGQDATAHLNRYAQGECDSPFPNPVC